MSKRKRKARNKPKTKRKKNKNKNGGKNRKIRLRLSTLEAIATLTAAIVNLITALILLRIALNG